MELASNDRVSESKVTYNQTMTSGEDFKEKVQKKIIEMSNEMRNPSPIRSGNTTHTNLDSYLKG
jgi:hypothetical protein